MNDEKWDRWGRNVAVAGLVLVGLAGFIALIDAFCESLAWGLASFLIPLASLIYLIAHRHRPWAARVGMILLLGVGLITGSVFGLGQTKRVSERIQDGRGAADPFGREGAESDGDRD